MAQEHCLVQPGDGTKWCPAAQQAVDKTRIAQRLQEYGEGAAGVPGQGHRVSWMTVLRDAEQNGRSGT